MEIGDIFLLASERSERYTLSRSSMKNAYVYPYIYIYICIGTSDTLLWRGPGVT